VARLSPYRERDARALPRRGLQRRAGVALQQVDLAREPHDRRAGPGRRDGLAATQQHPTQPRLDGLDALAHRRGRDAQRAGRALEAAGLDDRGDRAQLVERQVGE